MAKYIKKYSQKKEFVDWFRTFVAQKYPTMSPTYLDEAEGLLFK